MGLLNYQRQFATLRMNMRGGWRSPHKVALLLAVLDLIDANEIVENRIYFDASLREAFSRRFTQLAAEGDSDRPFLPFFHLRSSGFWHHKVREDAGSEYERLTTVKGPAQLAQAVSYAYFDEELFEILQFSLSRAMLRESLLHNLDGSEVHERLQTTGWDWLECEMLVADYFEMLSCELRGESYSKTAHRNALLARLNGRNRGSLEFKHQNVSAVLIELGQPYIQGYKPRFNYQAQLKTVVRAHLAARRPSFDLVTEMFVEQIPGLEFDWSSVFDKEIPERIEANSGIDRAYAGRRFNYLQKEVANRLLGAKGEEFVLEFERRRLGDLLRSDLADQVEWSSKEVGDGLGYDIRSFDADTDAEHFIEVKTTNSGKYFPFYISANEVAFSKDRADQYSLYRVFSFRDRARLFSLRGDIDQYVNLQPTTYRAGFR